MKLNLLLDHLTPLSIIGNANLDIGDISIDSRNVSSNTLFIALKGSLVNGHHFIDSAIQNGATAVLYCEDLPQFHEKIVYIRVNDTEKVLADISTIFFQTPSKDLKLFGVTGTNGKTTISSLLEWSMSHLNFQTGLIGTMKYKINQEEFPSPNTTPNALDLQRLLSRMKNNAVSHVAMEVSSHGLSLDRVKHCLFDVAIFTNLSQDHLDFHASMDDYKKAKGRLFQMVKTNGTSILNADDPSVDYFHSVSNARVLTYGIKQKADYSASDIVLTAESTSFVASTPKGKYPIVSNLVGEFNVYNLLAVIATLEYIGVDTKKIQNILSLSPTIDGRMQTIRLSKGNVAIVDYAHTPDALENVLLTIKNFTKGKIVTVVGCGGNRDKTKRPLMAKIANTLSSMSIFTSDNPRFEQPESILEDMLKGVDEENLSKVLTIVDRREAIQTALLQLHENDTLLVAGKGHETYQIIGNETIHFDDCEVIVNNTKKIKEKS